MELDLPENEELKKKERAKHEHLIFFTFNKTEVWTVHFTFYTETIKA